MFFSTKFVKRRENLFIREHIQKTNLSKCPLSLLLVMEVIANWKAKVHFLLDSWELSATLIGLVARIFVVVVWVTFHTDWKLSHATFPTSSKLRFIYLFIYFFLFEFPNKKMIFLRVQIKLSVRLMHFHTKKKIHNTGHSKTLSICSATTRKTKNATNSVADMAWPLSFN